MQYIEDVIAIQGKRYFDLPLPNTPHTHAHQIAPRLQCLFHTSWYTMDDYVVTNTTMFALASNHL